MTGFDECRSGPCWYVSSSKILRKKKYIFLETEVSLGWPAHKLGNIPPRGVPGLLVFLTEASMVVLLPYAWIMSGWWSVFFLLRLRLGGPNPQVEKCKTFNGFPRQSSHFWQHLSLCLPDEVQSQDWKAWICPKSLACFFPSFSITNVISCSNEK